VQNHSKIVLNKSMYSISIQVGGYIDSFVLNKTMNLSKCHSVANMLIYLYWRFQKQIKRETIQDSTSQKIFDLEKLVFLLVLASIPWW